MRPTSQGMIHDLDATGLLCPLPVLKARKRLAGLEVGAQLRLRADDPAAVIDVPHFCAQAGHVLLESSQDGDVQIYLIEKTA
ncbi:sulfurtransferase TusA family protein [Sulfitobacter sp. HNIBRBA2951]|uniref:sulfurtransferase TusA family protein n=1 Tax=Sulfitobacter aquimarinus TaxID=3158557 RepID=UPI0032DEB36E